MQSNQAQKIIAKFGGARKLAALLGYSPVRCYKWTYEREKGGSGGFVSHDCIPAIKLAAELEGIELTAEDWMP